MSPILFYATFSHLLNITFSYLVINNSIWKNKKSLLLLLLMIGSAGIVSDKYPFVNDLVFFLFLFLLTIKVQRKQNIFLSTIIVVCPFLIVGILSFFSSKLLLLFLSLNIGSTKSIILLEFFFYIIIYLISYVVKTTFIPFIQSQQKEKLTAVTFIGLFVLRQIFEIYVYYFGNEWLSIVSIIIIVAFSVLIYLFIQSVSTSQTLKLEVEKQQIEVKYMNEYAKETTKQYNEIRKFRHDYVNILSSLEYFIQTKDMDKLAAYYQEFIQPTHESLAKGAFNFQELKNIESDEIKSIIAIKLLSARENELDIHIEIPDRIPQKLPINPVSLIRMLGIILDNSIEESSQIANGTVEIGIFDMEMSYLFIIKNSVRENIEPLYQLEVEGYSTKGENRGLGLSNLNEISQREKNLTLETEITPSAFIQKITLMKGEN
ncbi:sensor histidine kinase [Vagococcus fluvialis]|uniref:sensor histidine kinase n=2 Tax=Vagococcus fluvialis TaxID=2738 RepID=UPI00143338D7|nr:GHKL domain-containing protein [Vagococcus fluvialis]MCM2139512.1 GHKL domain-containing protein [Vagococcus fluvialis]MDT2782037.1 GHKL domain-containing protein [Vagococcus fluvialis]NKC60953.1 GHKL domain-containing protein [Vagococcus fluvialis]NKD51868.1 GHKL domain-containing protein [Vagococcus fluvialis]